MNDLAEKALRGLETARREVTARPVPLLAAAGFATACLVVVTGARLGAAPAAVPIGGWLGLLPSAAYRITDPGLGFVMLAGLLALVGLWLLALRLTTRRRLTPRQLVIAAAAWAVPFAVGPPVLSTDLFSSVARGLLARNGLSPYHHPPTALGGLRIVDAIDPDWRGTQSTDGPLESLVQHLVVSVSGGRVVPAVVALRLLAVAAFAAIGWCATRLNPSQRGTALVLTVLNPAVLIVVVSGGQFVGVFGALLLAALVAARRRRWDAAVALACLAAGVKPVGLLAVVALIAFHTLSRDRPLRARVAARDGVVAVATLALCAVSVPYGLGWLWNLSGAIHETVPFAPSSLIAQIGRIVPTASFDDLQAGGRIAAGAAGLTALCAVFATIRRRPLEVSIGLLLLAAGVFAPVVYPSLLLWGVLCLAPTAEGVVRDWVIALSCAACVLAPVGFGERGAVVVTSAALVLIAAVLWRRAGRVSAGERRSGRPVRELS